MEDVETILVDCVTIRSMVEKTKERHTVWCFSMGSSKLTTPGRAAVTRSYLVGRISIGFLVMKGVS